MNSLSRQKKELEEDKEKLIGHIEAKLAELRQQRQRLEDPNYRVEVESQADSVPLESIIKQIPVLVQVNENTNINGTSEVLNATIVNNTKSTIVNSTKKPQTTKTKPQTTKTNNPYNTKANPKPK